MISGLGGAERWLSRPRLLALLIIALYLAVTPVLIVQLIAWLSGRPPNWGAAIGPMVGGAVGAVWGSRIRLRRLATPAMWAEYRQALRTGVLPPNAERSDWPSLLADRIREQRQSIRVQYAIGSLFVAGWLALLIGHRMGGWIWLLGAGVALFVVLTVTGSRSYGQRLARLREQLDARQ